MSVLDNILISFFAVFTAIFVSFMHGASLEIESNLPAFLQGGLFISAVNIGFPILETMSVFVFFLMYIISSIGALRTRTRVDFVGVQLLYGFMSVGLMPILSHIYTTITNMDPMFSVAAATFNPFFNNLPLISAVFFVFIIVALAWGGSRGTA